MKDYTTSSMYVVEPTDTQIEVFHHNNLIKWEETENNLDQEDLKHIDPLNYTTIKKYDMHIRQPPVYRQRKVSISEKSYFNFFFF